MIEDQIILALKLSLQITAIHVIFIQGELLGWLRIWAANNIDEACINTCKKLKLEKPVTRGKAASEYIQKPMWGCVKCMASIWTILLTNSINIPLIFIVCGINVLIDKIAFSE